MPSAIVVLTAIESGCGFLLSAFILYLLLSQTSCFRYWGHGYWTDVAREICRRGLESVDS